MQFSRSHKQVWGWVLALGVAALDQWSKAEVLKAAQEARIPDVLLPFFNLVLVWNKGVSFGLFGHFPEWMPLLITLATSGIVIILAVWLMRVRDSFTAVALGFIIGGAVGNIIDRVRYHAVTDFIDVHAGSYHWPAFNVGDSAIFIGVVILLFIGIVRQGKQE